MSISVLEFWILETLIESASPAVIYFDSGLSDFFNGFPADEKIEDVPAALQSLATLSLIAFKNEDRDVLTVEPDVDSLRRLPEGTNCYLSEAGGSVWEQNANPDWNRYWSMVSEFASASELIYNIEGERDMICSATSRDRIEFVMTHLADLGYEMRAGTERWSVEQPWNATYWKSFPVGHLLNFRGTPMPLLRDETGMGNEIRYELHHWYDRPY